MSFVFIIFNQSQPSPKTLTSAWVNYLHVCEYCFWCFSHFSLSEQTLKRLNWEDRATVSMLRIAWHTERQTDGQGRGKQILNSVTVISLVAKLELLILTFETSSSQWLLRHHLLSVQSIVWDCLLCLPDTQSAVVGPCNRERCVGMKGRILHCDLK